LNNAASAAFASLPNVNSIPAARDTATAPSASSSTPCSAVKPSGLSALTVMRRKATPGAENRKSAPWF
jgi:hypothetical protein